MEKEAISVRVESNMLRQFDHQAEKLGYTRAEAVREVMRRFITKV